MRFSFALSAVTTLAFSQLALAAPAEKIIPCIDDAPIDPAVEAKLNGVVKAMQAAEAARLGGGNSTLLASRQASTRTVNVYWHTIQAGTTAAQGAVTSTQIANQIARLNTYLSPIGFRFVLAGTDVTTSATYFNSAIPSSTTQTNMKRALRRGTKADLNVYSVAFTDYQGLLGYATFPWSYAGAPTDDGVVFNFRTVPGGSLASYNSGGTLVHEVGHWIGLYHTFQGGCSDTAGDYVSDTPAESTAHYSCATATDSCPNLPGRDPLSNFMSYTPDPCKTGFTAGQSTRAIAAWTQYRA